MWGAWLYIKLSFQCIGFGFCFINHKRQSPQSSCIRFRDLISPPNWYDNGEAVIYFYNKLCLHSNTASYYVMYVHFFLSDEIFRMWFCTRCNYITEFVRRLFSHSNNTLFGPFPNFIVSLTLITYIWNQDFLSMNEYILANAGLRHWKHT